MSPDDANADARRLAGLPKALTQPGERAAARYLLLSRRRRRYRRVVTTSMVASGAVGGVFFGLLANQTGVDAATVAVVTMAGALLMGLAWYVGYELGNWDGGHD